MPFWRRNWRLKFEMFLKPEAKQTSVMGSASSLISNWLARLMRRRLTYWPSAIPVWRRKLRENPLGLRRERAARSFSLKGSVRWLLMYERASLIPVAMKPEGSG